MDRYQKIIDSFFLWYESKRYHKIFIFISSFLFLFLLNNFLILKEISDKKKQIQQDCFVLQYALQPFYFPVCITSYCRSTLAVSLFDAQRWMIGPDLLHVERDFFLWPFVLPSFHFLVNPSLWGFNSSSVIYFFYPIMFLDQNKGQNSLLFAQIQPHHFSKLNLITSPEQIETEEVKPSRAGQKIIFEEVPISQLKLVGLFLAVQSKKSWGIVQKADEQISKVEIGDTLGFERYIVMAIELKKIIVQTSDMKETIQLLL